MLLKGMRLQNAQLGTALGGTSEIQAGTGNLARASKKRARDKHSSEPRASVKRKLLPSVVGTGDSLT